MRLMVYGMQSSGASTLALLLAQTPQCGAFVDVWAPYLAPVISNDLDVIAKVVVTTAFPLAQHRERFRPDRTVLMLRDPRINYQSLLTKVYRHHCGFIEEKFLLLDSIFTDEKFDAIVHYEDLIFNSADVIGQMAALGWRCSDEALHFSRRQEDIVAFNKANFSDVTERLDYGMGKFRGGKLRTDLVGLGDLPQVSPVDELCPKLALYYKELITERGSAWRDESSSMLGSNRQVGRLSSAQ